jgi:hypothetical protein
MLFLITFSFFPWLLQLSAAGQLSDIGPWVSCLLHFYENSAISHEDKMLLSGLLGWTHLSLEKNGIFVINTVQIS